MKPTPIALRAPHPQVCIACRWTDHRQKCERAHAWPLMSQLRWLKAGCQQVSCARTSGWLPTRIHAAPCVRRTGLHEAAGELAKVTTHAGLLPPVGTCAKPPPRVYQQAFAALWPHTPLLLLLLLLIPTPPPLHTPAAARHCSRPGYCCCSPGAEGPLLQQAVALARGQPPPAPPGPLQTPCTLERKYQRHDETVTLAALAACRPGAGYRRRRASRSDSSRVRMSPGGSARGRGRSCEGQASSCELHEDAEACACPCHMVPVYGMIHDRGLHFGSSKVCALPPPSPQPLPAPRPRLLPLLTLADGPLHVPHDEAVLVVQELDANLGHLRTYEPHTHTHR